MADSSRQLMFYRNNIAQSNVIINYTGTILKSTTRIENPNYLILDLEITEDARPGNIPIVFEYQREILFSVDYQLKSRADGSRERYASDFDRIIIQTGWFEKTMPDLNQHRRGSEQV